jgi:hypothetical protein
MTRQPTTDLYFVNAMAPDCPLVAEGCASPIRRRGENSFIMGDFAVRRDTPYIMREALAWSGHLAYVIDDDVAAGMAWACPPPYRARLADFDKRFHRDLLARADKVLAASDALVEALTASEQAARRLGPRLARIDPVWRQPWPTPPISRVWPRAPPCAWCNWARAAMARAGRWRARDAGYSGPAPQRQLHLFLAAQLDGRLEKHPRARRLEPMTWREYQRWMARQRFHLALYPLAQQL